MTLQVNKERIKAIVIDDDEDSSDSICQALEISGINVIGKGFDGEQAYQLYKTLTPDIVIMDMNMPNYDGAYALEKIKQDYLNVIGKGFDGEQAYQLYKTLTPDIVIMDMNMPNYDGAYALEKIKQDYPNA